MSEDYFKQLLLYAAFFVIVSWLGGIIPILKTWNSSRQKLFISFGAGALLGAAFLHMIPEAAAITGAGLGLPMLVGFLLLYVLEKFVMLHICEANIKIHTVGWSSFIGLSIHSLATGVALGAGLMANELGVVVFGAILLHKFPEAFSLSCLLLREQMSRMHILLFIISFSLMVPAGALLTLLFENSISESMLGWLIAFSSGTFIHVAAGDLLPEMHVQSNSKSTTLLPFLAGILIMWIATLVHI